MVWMSSILRGHGSKSLIILNDPALGSSSFSSLADLCRTLGGPLSNPWLLVNNYTKTNFRRTITLAKMSSYRQKEKHVTCPFIPSHSILPERLYKHIRKCSVQNPDIASKMCVCPFLWTHIIKEEDFEEHVRHCPRRDTIRRWFPNLNITDWFCIWIVQVKFR